MPKLLVVVDYQEDFVSGALGFKKAEELEEGIYRRIKAYLDRGDHVLFTYDTHSREDYAASREGKHLPVLHCVPGTPGHELYGQLREFTEEKHLWKYNFGAREIMELDFDVESIEIIGVVTNICVISNAILLQTRYPNAEITIDASLCASFDDVLHEKALDVMAGLQMNIINR